MMPCLVGVLFANSSASCEAAKSTAEARFPAQPLLCSLASLPSPAILHGPPSQHTQKYLFLKPAILDTARIFTAHTPHPKMSLKCQLVFVNLA